MTVDVAFPEGWNGYRHILLHGQIPAGYLTVKIGIPRESMQSIFERKADDVYRGLLILTPNPVVRGADVRGRGEIQDLGVPGS
jgi:hypothetical protein